MNPREALEAAIADDPTTPEPYLVYADCLVEAGDRRGELIAMSTPTATRRIREAAAALLRDHRAELLGGLADCDDVVTAQRWFMGFLASCRVAQPRARFEARDPLQLADVIGWILDEPGAGRFLQELVVGAIDPGRGHHYASICAAIAARPRPALRKLQLGDFGTMGLSWSTIEGLDAVWPAVPNLRELVLRAGRMPMRAIDLPKLEKLTTITPGLDDASLAAIAGARWPALRELSLQIGLGRAGAALDDRLVEPLLAGAHVPRLRALGITNCEFADELCARLVDAPLVARLASLDLSMGTMTERGAAILVANRARFAHLRLNVHDNYLDIQSRVLLEEAFPTIVFGDQRDEYEEDEDGYVILGRRASAWD